MKPAADYFAATMPEPWQILGLRLRPFSLGHYKLLRRFDCAFVDGNGREATREDLVFGVLACSMLPDDFAEFIQSPDYEENVKEWGAKIGLFDLEEKAKLFKDYIEYHSVVPKYWEERTGTGSGAHWAQCVEVCLRAEIGWSKKELDETSLAKAFADYFKHAETQGAIKLMTEEEVEQIEKEAVCGA